MTPPDDSPLMRFLLSGKLTDPVRINPPASRPLPMGEPPRSMPGYCVGIELPEQHSSLRAVLVVEMAWAEQEGSDSYLRAVPFGVGARILCTPAYGIAPLDGFVIVPVVSVVAWTPAPEVSA